MPKVPLSTITSGYGTVDALNQNFDAIEAAFDNALSRNGDIPNQMSANLDMNGFSILNQGNPITVEGFNWEGQWLTATAYQVGDVIQQGGSAYVCVVAHTSSVFATDLSAFRWQLVAQANLPTQTGNSGKYLTTNGTSASWDDVRYTPLGTGAVQRTVDSKLEEYVSVKDFGAVGDGVTNDTTSVQACLTASAGKTVIFESGKTYRLSAIIVPANTWIEATGATLTFAAAGNITAITFTNGGGINGGEIVGAGGSVYNAVGTGIKASGTNNYPAAPTFITCPKITNVKIRDFAYAGVDLLYVQNGYVTYCEVYNCGYAGIQGQSLKYVNIDDNIVHDIAGSGAPDTYGIAATSGEQNATATPRSEHVSICRNKVYNVPNWEAIDTHGGSDIVIDSNIITNCRFGVMVVPLDTEAGSQYLGSQRVVVTNNIVTGTGNGTGIAVIGGTFERASNIVVSNNILTNCSAANNTNDGAIRSYNVSGVDFIGNTIRTPYVTGINLISDVYYANVVSNVIIDPRDNTYTTPRCIAITSNNVYCSIHSNQLTFNSNSVGTYVAILGIVIAGGLTGLDVNIGQNSYIGIAANKLSYSEGTSTGVYVTGMMTQKGTANLSLTDVAQTTLTVTFPKRFPATPRISLLINGSPVPGSVTKHALLTVYSVTATDFLISARPFDLTTFGGSGTLSVEWVATL